MKKNITITTYKLLAEIGTDKKPFFSLLVEKENFIFFLVVLEEFSNTDSEFLFNSWRKHVKIWIKLFE